MQQFSNSSPLKHPHSGFCGGTEHYTGRHKKSWNWLSQMHRKEGKHPTQRAIGTPDVTLQQLGRGSISRLLQRDSQRKPCPNCHQPASVACRGHWEIRVPVTMSPGTQTPQECHPGSKCVLYFFLKAKSPIKEPAGVLGKPFPQPPGEQRPSLPPPAQTQERGERPGTAAATR